MKSELVKKALEKVGDPNLLVNLLSRRVRQLNSAGGAGSRPLISETAGLGAADIALTELVEGKQSWNILPEEPAAEETGGRRRKKSG